MKLPPPPAPRRPRRPGTPTRHRRHLAPPRPVLPFRVFIAYGDVPAAGRAMRTINDVIASVPPHHALVPMLWRFDQLTAAKWREVALVDAARADVVVLTSTCVDGLTPELDAWIGTFLGRKRGARTTLVALFGQDDAWTITLEESESVAEQQRLVA